MADEFGGIPIEQSVQSTDQFGGIPIEPTAQQPTSPEQPGLVQRIQTDITNRQQEAYKIGAEFQLNVQDILQNAKTAVGEDQFDPTTAKLALAAAQSGYQLIGKGFFGTALDIIGEGVSTALQGAGKAIDIAGQGFGQSVQSLTGINIGMPASATDATKQMVLRGLSTVANTDIGEAAIEALKGGVNQWKDWKKRHPQLAADIEATFDIAAFFLPTKFKGNPNAGPSTIMGDMGRAAEASAEKLNKTFATRNVEKPATILGAGANTLEQAAARQTTQKKLDNVYQLIRPKQTQAVKEAEVMRTSTPVAYGRTFVDPAKREKEIAQEVMKIPGIGEGAPIARWYVQKNFNIVKDYNTKLAIDLERLLKENKQTAPKNFTIDYINKEAELTIRNNPLIKGDARDTVTSIAEHAARFIRENEASPLGILKARQQLDDFVQTLKPKVFDANAENALTYGLRSARTAMNDVMDAYISHGIAKDNLRRQTLLFDAMDNMIPKAAQESKFVIGTMLKNVHKTLGFQNEAIIAASTAFGISKLAAAEMLAPVMTAALGLGTVVVGGRQIFISPKTKTGIALLLRASDQALKVTKNIAMRKELQADRAYLIHLVKNSKVLDETQMQNLQQSQQPTQQPSQPMQPAQQPMPGVQ